MLIGAFEDSKPVLTDGASGDVVSVGMIRDRMKHVEQFPPGLCFLIVDGSLDAAQWILACLEVEYPIALIDASRETQEIKSLIENYRPQVIIDLALHHLRDFAQSLVGRRGRLVAESVWIASDSDSPAHLDLAVLLSTSGSTGSSKFVRLSKANILSNAKQISLSLDISASDKGMAILPFHYSFGLSILTSHIFSTSTVVVANRSVLSEEFWTMLGTREVTILPGVPTTFVMLKRLGFEQRNIPHLRALIQAGGRLPQEMVVYFHELMSRRGGRFYVMYGQTEASPRMSCLPSEALPRKIGSVGVAMPGGNLRIIGERGETLPARVVGEVVYEGPNVMMGYATSREELALGDLCGGLLHTGDLGYLDEEAYLFLVGRIKRMAKVAGVRVSLDELEYVASSILGSHETVVALDLDPEGVIIAVENLSEVMSKDLRRAIVEKMGLPFQLVLVRAIVEIPKLSNGKIDYVRTREALQVL